MVAPGKKATMSPDDILSAILAIAKKRAGKNRFAFRAHDSKLQQIFSKLKDEFDSPLIKRFVFSDSGPVPYSPILNESVSKLQLSGLIGRENPDYEVIFLREAGETYFNEFICKQLSDEMTQLEKIADAFLTHVEIV